MQPRAANASLNARLNLLWGMALLGLFLLPSDYRAGAEIAHGHSFVQLWVDAGDGTVHHTHHDHHAPDPSPAQTTSWLEPLVSDAGSAGSTGMNDERPDVAEQQESTPSAGGFHLLLTMVNVVLASGLHLMPEVSCDRTVVGLSPRIILPPPRWTPHIA